MPETDEMSYATSQLRQLPVASYLAWLLGVSEDEFANGVASHLTNVLKVAADTSGKKFRDSLAQKTGRIARKTKAKVMQNAVDLLVNRHLMTYVSSYAHGHGDTKKVLAVAMVEDLLKKGVSQEQFAGLLDASVHPLQLFLLTSQLPEHGPAKEFEVIRKYAPAIRMEHHAKEFSELAKALSDPQAAKDPGAAALKAANLSVQIASKNDALYAFLTRRGVWQRMPAEVVRSNTFTEFDRRLDAAPDDEIHYFYPEQVEKLVKATGVKDLARINEIQRRVKAAGAEIDDLAAYAEEQKKRVSVNNFFAHWTRLHPRPAPVKKAQAKGKITFQAPTGPEIAKRDYSVKAMMQSLGLANHHYAKEMAAALETFGHHTGPRLHDAVREVTSLHQQKAQEIQSEKGVPPELQKLPSKLTNQEKIGVKKRVTQHFSAVGAELERTVAATIGHFFLKNPNPPKKPAPPKKIAQEPPKTAMEGRAEKILAGWLPTNPSTDYIHALLTELEYRVVEGGKGSHAKYELAKQKPGSQEVVTHSFTLPKEPNKFWLVRRLREKVGVREFKEAVARVKKRRA